MAWRSRRERLPEQVRRDWRAALPPGAPLTVLAWASGTDGAVIASPDRLSIEAGTDWRQLHWHRIEAGGWNEETRQLHWTTVAEPDDMTGRRQRGHVVLDEPGRIPEVFRERVQASFVFRQTVPVTETAGIVISARRDLGDSRAPLAWHVNLQRGLSWGRPEVRTAAEAALARFRAEYDPA